MTDPGQGGRTQAAGAQTVAGMITREGRASLWTNRPQMETVEVFGRKISST